MAKNLKVVIMTGKAEDVVVDVVAGSGSAGLPTRIRVEMGARFVLRELEPTLRPQAPKIRGRRVGKDLHVYLEGYNAPDLILLNYFEVMPEGVNALLGQAENGAFYEFWIGTAENKTALLALQEGSVATNLVLAGDVVAGISPAVAGLVPVLAGPSSWLVAGGTGLAALVSNTQGDTYESSEAWKIVVAYDQPGTDTAPTKEQINGLIAGLISGGQPLAKDAVTDDALAAVLAAIDAANSDGKPLSNRQELADVVKAAMDAYVGAIEKISLYAETGVTAPLIADYAAAGVIGVSSANLEAINSAVNGLMSNTTDSADDRDATNSRAEIQAIVDSYNKIIVAADGNATDNTTGAAIPAASDYAAIGVTGVSAASAALLSNVIDNKVFEDINTVAEVQALADAAAAAVGYTGGNTPPSATQLNALAGGSGVTADNLQAVLAALAAANTNTTGANANQPVTQAELQTLINGITSAAQALGDFAQAEAAGLASVTSTAPSLSQYSAAGVTGVTSANLAAINDALASTAITGAQADTPAEIQVIVDSYNKIIAAADGNATDNTTGAAIPAASDYAAIGVTGVSAASAILLSDVIDNKAFEDINTVAEVQALADAAAAAVGYTGTNTAPSAAQLNALAGGSGVTADNLQAVLAALAAANTNTTGANANQPVTQAELQGLINGITSAAQALGDFAQAETAGLAAATTAAPELSQYSAAGVTGVTSANLAAVNDALASAAITGAQADTPAEIQAIVDSYNKIIAAADGNATDNTTGTAVPAASDYTAIGVTGVSDASATLLSDAIDNKSFEDINTVAEVQALADAAAAAVGYTGTNTAPSADQLNALAGGSGVTADNLQAVLAALAAANTNTTGANANQPVTQAELQGLISGISSAAAALGAFAQAEATGLASATSTAPSLSQYSAAGVTGVTSANLAAINDALASAAITGAQADTPAEIQAIVDSYNKIIAAADGNATDNTSGAAVPTASDYAAIGVTGVSAASAALLSDAIDNKAFEDINTVAEVQALADAAAAAVGYTGTNTAPSASQLNALAGGSGVTADNLQAVLAALAAANTNTTGANANQPVTQAELQTLINGITSAAAALGDFAQAETAGLASASAAAPGLSQYSAAGVTGVTSANLAAINDALASAAVTSAQADTPAEIQAIVDSYNKIIAAADGNATDNTTGTAVPAASDYTVIGVTGVSAASAALLSDVIDNKSFEDINTVAEVQALADAAAAAVGYTGTNTAPSADQLNALAGGSGVTADNLQAVLAALAAANTNTTGANANQPVTQAELQGLISGISSAAAALGAFAQAEATGLASATSTAPSLSQYSAAGVTGVTSANLAAINDALASAAITGAQADTPAEIQAIVDSYNKIIAAADGNATDNTTGAAIPAASDYAAIGVTGVSAASAILLSDVIDNKTFEDINTVAEVQALADAAAAAVGYTGGNTPPSATQLNALAGGSGVTADNLQAVLAALAAANSNTTGANANQPVTQAELQGLINGITSAAQALGDFAQAETAGLAAATTAAPELSQYSAAGVTGVTSANLEAINDALASGAVSGSKADTPAEIQAIVDSYNKIIAAADGNATDNTTGTAVPAASDYTVIGVTGVSAASAALLSDVIDNKSFEDINTVAEVQALADAAAAAVSYTGGNTAPSASQLNALAGGSGVTADNLQAVLAALAAANTNTTGANANQPVTQAELQALVQGINNALSTIEAAAQGNTSSTLTSVIYQSAGIAGVNDSNVALINSLLDTAGIQGATVNTVSELQATVNAAIKLNGMANGNLDGSPLLNPDDVAALGLSSVIASPAELLLLNQVLDRAPANLLTGSNPGEAVTQLAGIVQRVMQTAADQTPSPALSANDLQTLGLGEVSSALLGAYLSAIAATANTGTAVDTLSELQSLILAVNWTNAQPALTIEEATGGINASELANGIQAAIALPVRAALGDVLTLTVTNTVTSTTQVFTHALTQADLDARSASVTLPASVVQTSGQVVDGNYSVSSQITNASAQTTASASLNFTLDTTAPTITLTSIAGDAVSASSNTVGEFNAAERGTSTTAPATPVVIIGSTDAQAGQSVQVTLNAKTYSAQVQANGSWSVTIPDADAIALNHGNTYGITVQTSDLAGNPGTNSSFSLRANTALPDVPTVNVARTNDTTPSLSGLARKVINPAGDIADLANYKELEPGDTLQISLKGSPETTVQTWSFTVGTAASGFAYNAVTRTWSLDTQAAGLAPLSDGRYDVVVSSQAGGVTKTDVSSNELDINTQPPIITLAALAGDDRINALERGQGLVLTGTTDAQPGSSVTLSLNGQTYTAQVQAGSSASLNTFEVTVPASAVQALTDGTTAYAVSVTNGYGSTAVRDGSVLVDTVAPAAPGLSLLEVDAVVNAVELANGLQTRVTLPTVGNTAVQAGDTVILSVTDPIGVNRSYTHTVTAEEAAAGAADVTVPSDRLAGDGSYSLVARITDRAGNPGTASAALSFTRDATAPGQSGGATPAAVPAPVVAVEEAVSGINAAELSDGLQASVTLPSGSVVGDVLSFTVTGPDGVQRTFTHTVSQDQAISGQVILSLPNTLLAQDGVYTIATISTDVAGNTSTVGSTSVTLSAAIGIIADYAASGAAAPTAIAYDKAGVTGVSDANLAAINDAINNQTGSDSTLGNSNDAASADSSAKVQAIVNAYNAILAEANDSTATAGDGTADATPDSDPTAAQYAAIGVTLGDAATDAQNLALLNDIVGAAQVGEVDTIAEINELARIANAIQTVANNGTPSPTLTVADLTKIGLATTGVTANNLPTLLAAIAAKNNDGSETDSLAELQTLIDALDKTAPTATLALSDTALKAGETSVVTITFSKAVSGLTAGDFTVGTGSISEPVSADGGITWTATYTPNTNTEASTDVITLNAGAVADLSGNLNSAAASSANYTVDTLAPAAPASPPSSYADNVGSITSASSTAAVTDDAIPGIYVGTVPAGTTPSLYVNGTKVDATYDSATGLLTPTNAVSSAGASGTSHSLTYTLTDAAGNESGQSPALVITVDTSNPMQTVSYASMTKDTSTGSATADWTTADASAGRLVSGFVSAALGADEQVAVYSNGTLIGNATLNVARTAWAITDTRGYSESWTYTAKVVDAAGNAGAVAARQVSLDITADTAPFITGVFDSVSSTSLPSGSATAATLSTVRGTAVSGSTVYLYTNNGSQLVGSAVADGSGNWSINTLSNVQAGPNTFAAKQVDVNGNESVMSNLWTVYTPGTNLLPNGNFEAGNTGFFPRDTSYVAPNVFSANNFGAATQYTVASKAELSNLSFVPASSSTSPALTRSAITTQSNANGAVSWYRDYNDSNPQAALGGLSSEKMLVGNVQDTSGFVIVWLRNVQVEAGKTYLFTLNYQASGFALNPLTANIAGVNIPLGYTAGVTGGRLVASYTATANTSFNLHVWGNNNGAVNSSSGDYILDNISFSEQPTTANNLVAGVFSGVSSGAEVVGYAGGALDTLAGNDTITVASTSLQTLLANGGRINGGAGLDKLVLAAGTTLDLTTLTQNQTVKNVQEVEVVELQGNSMLTLSANSVLSLGSASASTMSGFAFSSTQQVADGSTAATGSTSSTGKVQFVVNGQSTDQVDLKSLLTDGFFTATGSQGNTGLRGQWQYKGTVSLGGNSYKVYDHSTTQAQALIDSDVSVTAIDTTPPTVTIVLADTALKLGETSPVTITFSEAVTGLTASDFSVPNGTLSTPVSGNGGISWTATYTPNADVQDLTNVITLNAGAVNDLAGNANAAASSANFMVDNVPPPAPVVAAATTLDTFGRMSYSGTSEPGTVIRADWTDGTTTTPVLDESGAWTVTAPDSAPQGTFTVTSTDVVGNSSTTSLFMPQPAMVPNSTAGNQSFSQVTELNDGGWVVSWQTVATSPDLTRSHYFQRYAANGSEVGPEVLVAQTTNASPLRDRSDMTTLADGGWIMTYANTDGNSLGVFQKRYSATGVLMGGEVRVNDEIANMQANPQVAAMADGGWLVVWDSSHTTSGDIYQLRYKADGSLYSGAQATRVNATTSLAQDFAGVTTLADGGWVVSWVSQHVAANERNVYQQRFAANGTAVGGEVMVNITNADERSPQVIALDTGGWVTTWTSGVAGSNNYQIYQRTYGADGTAGVEVQVNTNAASDLSFVSVARLADGGWVTTWRSVGAVGDEVYQQRFAANGQKVGVDAPVNNYNVGVQGEPDVAGLADGGWVVSWTSAEQDGDGRGIYQQRFHANGQAYNADGATLFVQPPIISGLQDDAGSSKGFVSSGRLTDDGTPMFVGTAAAGSTVELFNQGVSMGSTQTLANGSWSFTPSALLSGGTYSITATSTLNGKSASTQHSFEYVLDAAPLAPIVFDLSRDGSIGYTQQVMDVNTDGQLDFSAWAAREDGVLVWDKFGDGLVTDASQYAFTQYGGSTDLEGLRVGFDSNADGVFNEQDAKFAEFAVWQDANGNGVSDAGEVRSLADWGIQEIKLQSDGVQREPALGVMEAGRTTATSTDESSMLVSDAAFEYTTLTQQQLLAYQVL